MLERFGKLSEEQLTIGIAIIGVTCAVAVLLFGLLGVTDIAKPALAAAGIVEDGSAGQPTPTVVAAAVLPPTWTPRATSTSTTTPTQAPTNTPEPTAPPPTETAGIPTATSTPEPDYAATVAAAQSATPVIPPTNVPAPAPPAPVIPTNIPAPPPPPPPAIPTQPPIPTATPQPLYVLSELLGGPDCSYTGISGTVYNRDGSVRPGVSLEVFNEFGYMLAPVTNNSGYYEAFLDSQPRGDLAGPWHIRVLENGAQNSNEIIVTLNASCTNASDVTKVVANFYRTQ